MRLGPLGWMDGKRMKTNIKISISDDYKKEYLIHNGEIFNHNNIFSGDYNYHTLEVDLSSLALDQRRALFAADDCIFLAPVELKKESQKNILQHKYTGPLNANFSISLDTIMWVGFRRLAQMKAKEEADARLERFTDLGVRSLIGLGFFCLGLLIYFYG